MNNDMISRQMALDFKVSRGLNENGILYVPYADVKKYLEQLLSVEPTLYGYNIEHLAFIATLLQKENISPEELKTILTDIGRIMQFVIDDIINMMQ